MSVASSRKGEGKSLGETKHHTQTAITKPMTPKVTPISVFSDLRLVASTFAGTDAAVGAAGSRVVFENSVLETTGSDCQILASVVESEGGNDA